ncbi:hypothetical protein [Nocardia brasiliensis]|uniref:O-acyltransferase WSD1 C-terminal domain-containing protein n=1 Tax=Nocardia brasiliensis (strain ATCC 700358 / HUJEG-1) TaxID=1133849 RepID=K0F6Y5_NOCB7|nr:hypothetical protein [Nocardia brasiliensis]AFU05497.1 hypothetical protein O3I_037750 [Nocardia brasiliensis ATCC 700358]OCF86230.1 hypothetical protein AW168_32805 [Nocardia brasiliensis]
MSAPGRLSVVDEIFLRTHRGLGTPIALQGLWRTADRIEAELLRRIHATLRTGPLGRRVVRPRVPGARRAWQANTRAHPLAWHEQPISCAALFPWADAQGADLDPETGPGWRLSATALTDGGSVVALTCSHALADGRALALAVDDALGGTELHAGAPVPGSDWADAGRQWSTVVRGTVRALRGGIPARPPAAPDRVDAPSGDAAVHSAVLQCSVADWDRAAMAHGGTTNSVFIWLIANTLWACGFPAAVIEASLPVDTRDEPRVDNDLAMTAIDVHRTDTPASIRAQARAAYERRMSSPGGMPEELLQVIPDRWAYALSKGAGERDILCSNIGTLPATLTALGTHRCTGVAARAIHPGLTAGQLPRTRLSGYLCRIADDYVVALVGLDPARIESDSALTDLASQTAATIDLPVRAW